MDRILKTKGLKPLKNPETYGETGFTEEKLQNIVFWISERQEDYMRAWLDGYTVEKPQLFLLRERIRDIICAKKEITSTESLLIIQTITTKNTCITNSPQQEIDSMQLGAMSLCLWRTENDRYIRKKFA